MLCRTSDTNCVVVELIELVGRMVKNSKSAWMFVGRIRLWLRRWDRLPEKCSGVKCRRLAPPV